MNEQEQQQLQQAFLQWLAQKTGAKSQEELQAVVQKLGEDGLKQAYQQFLQEMQGQVQAAKRGARLDYIKSLRGKCPNGFKVEYYKAGGRLCKKCVANEVSSKKAKVDPVAEFKCGRKIGKKN